MLEMLDVCADELELEEEEEADELDDEELLSDEELLDDEERLLELDEDLLDLLDDGDGLEDGLYELGSHDDDQLDG